MTLFLYVVACILLAVFILWLLFSPNKKDFFVTLIVLSSITGLILSVIDAFLWVVRLHNGDSVLKIILALAFLIIVSFVIGFIAGYVISKESKRVNER
ncbi:MAG: hypothetical protein LBS39_03840 [Campylobacteraceae bacterium]|jgi:hypothetical protein|nr:hypothetical protein [Campylobacteraceae bacterium]